MSHLLVLKHALPDIDVWDDRRIGGGEDWLREIKKAIARARVAILLVSEKFLTSDFITRKEIPAILRRRATDGLTVIPVVIRACAWNAVPWLKRLNARPEDGTPLSGIKRHKADEALANLAREIKAILESRDDSFERMPALLTQSVTPELPLTGQCQILVESTSPGPPHNPRVV